MPRPHDWRSLLPGVLLLGALVALVVAVLVFGRVGAVRGDKVRLYVQTDAARGVLIGTTEVWLDGQMVGKVADVRFLPVAEDTTRRVLIALDLLREYLPFVRRDSRAQVRSGGSLLGAPVVYLTSGSTRSPELAAGDTLLARPQSDPEGVTSQLAIASRDFPAIINNVKVLNAQLGTARGTLGAAIEGGGEELVVFRERASRLARHAMNGGGTFSLAYGDGRLMARAQQAMARADSIRTLLASDRGSFGRFRRDSTLLATVEETRNELSIVRARLERADGTAGRVLRDSAVTQEIAAFERELAALMSDLQHHPLRYVAF